MNALGAKTRVMELMTHENPDVRYRALMSVSPSVCLLPHILSADSMADENCLSLFSLFQVQKLISIG